MAVFWISLSLLLVNALFPLPLQRVGSVGNVFISDDYYGVPGFGDLFVKRRYL
jgi:hypothetical protein